MFVVIFSKIQSLQPPSRWYCLGYVLAVLGVASYLISGKLSTPFNSIVTLSAYSAWGIGFGLWIRPWLRKIWHSSVGKLALTLLHGLVLLLSIIPARVLVAAALGLPPQDFEVTVGICAVLLYIPVWLVVIMLLAGSLSLILMLFSALCMVMDLLMDTLVVLLLGDLFPVASRFRRFIKQSIAKFTLKSLARGLGALAIVLVVAYIESWYATTTEFLKSGVRGIAYLADYQIVSGYPGVDVHRKLRLHENGVVSYAAPRGWDISISVERVRNED